MDLDTWSTNYVSVFPWPRSIYWMNTCMDGEALWGVIHMTIVTSLQRSNGLCSCWKPPFLLEKMTSKTSAGVPEPEPTILMAERFWFMWGFQRHFSEQAAWRENKHQILVRQTISLHFIGFKDTNCLWEDTKVLADTKIEDVFSKWNT